MVAGLRARAATFARPLRLPPAATADVMRLCLAPAGEAWRAVTDLKALLADPLVRGAGLMPLLLHAAPGGAGGPSPEVRSVLRASTAHEHVRLDAVGPACAEAIRSEARPPLVLRGVALAFGTYDEPVLRHCHDLDLLVAGPAGGRTHPSGLPIARHASLFGPALPAVRLDDVAADAVPVVVAGQEARALHPADALVHVCGHAATRGRPAGPLWGLDAAMLVRRHPDLDWDRVVARARAWQVSGAVAPLLAWLTRELAVAVPGHALAALRDAARRTGPRARLRLRGARRVHP